MSTAAATWKESASPTPAPSRNGLGRAAIASTEGSTGPDFARVRRRERKGIFAPPSGPLRQAVGIRPLREEAVCRLLPVLVELGKRGEALRLFGEFRERLDD